MTRKQLNFRNQSFPCCGECIHVREIDVDSYYCSLMSEEEFDGVTFTSICDSFKSWKNGK